MAVPKRKSSKSRKNRKRSHHALTAKQTVKCKYCGADKLSHRVCKTCGK